MSKYILNAIGIVPAISLLWSAFFLLLMYGRAPGIAGVYEVADFFNVAIRQLPIIVLNLFISIVIARIFRPEESSDGIEISKLRTKFNKNKLAIRVFGWIAAVIAMLFSVRYPLVFAFMILCSVHFDHILRLLDKLSGGYVEKHLDRISFLGVDAIIFTLFLLIMTMWNVETIKLKMRSFDKSSWNCHEFACSRGSLYIESVGSGQLVYKDNFIYFLNDDGGVVISSPYNAGRDRPLVCSLVSNLTFCDNFT